MEGRTGNDDHWSPLDSVKECASRVGEASDAFRSDGR